MGAATALGLAVLVAQINPYAELSSEVGAGEMPVTVGQESRNTVQATVQPAGSLRLGPVARRLTVTYRPRVSWRRPNPADDNKPLLLHQGELSGDYFANEAWTFGFLSGVAYGEPDYTVLPLILGRTQTALPDIQRILLANASVFGTHHFDGDFAIGLRVDGNHRRTLNAPEEEMMPMPAPMGGPRLVSALANQTEVSGGPIFTYMLSARDQVDLVLDLSYAVREPETSFVVGFAALGWYRTLSPRHRLSLLGGAAYTKTSITDAGVTDESQGVWPLVTAAWTGRLYQKGGVGISAGAGLSAETVIDPVIVVAGPRGTALGNLGFRFGRYWALDADAAFTTSLRGDPAVGVGGATPDETAFATSIGARRELSRHFTIGARVRYADRGPHLDTPDFEFRAREVWGAVTLTWRSDALEASPRGSIGRPTLGTGVAGARRPSGEEATTTPAAPPGGATTTPAGTTPSTPSTTPAPGASLPGAVPPPTPEPPPTQPPTTTTPP